MPTVMVVVYGYDTKDYIVGPHERLIDDNADGTIDRNDQRALEYVVGEEHPRFTTVSAEDGTWEVTADLSAWADLIISDTVKRVEVAVMPALLDADGAMVAIDAFDVGDIDFSDPVQAMEYQHHIEFPYPTHGKSNCESCHVEGMYNVPAQDKSLAGILSASEVFSGTNKAIGEAPSYVTGPASRACGACHRATLINEDNAGELMSLNQHQVALG